MNKELRDKALELNEWLLNQEEVKEYLRYEKLIKTHPELSSLEEELKEMQKLIVNNRNDQIECDELIEEYNIKKELFFNNPIVYNYLSLKEEVNNLVQQVNSIINEELKHY